MLSQYLSIYSFWLQTVLFDYRRFICLTTDALVKIYIDTGDDKKIGKIKK